MPFQSSTSNYNTIFIPLADPVTNRIAVENSNALAVSVPDAVAVAVPITNAVKHGIDLSTANHVPDLIAVCDEVSVTVPKSITTSITIKD